LLIVSVETLLFLRDMTHLPIFFFGRSNFLTVWLFSLSVSRYRQVVGQFKAINSATRMGHPGLEATAQDQAVSASS
jgi:hypothetical protein